MEEDKQVVGNPASNIDKVKPESEVTKLTEDDLEQISAGTDNTQGQKTYGVQKDKMKTANKNAEAVKGLL